jgi:hypothetical protein
MLDRATHLFTIALHDFVISRRGASFRVGMHVMTLCMICRNCHGLMMVERKSRERENHQGLGQPLLSKGREKLIPTDSVWMGRAHFEALVFSILFAMIV